MTGRRTRGRSSKKGEIHGTSDRQPTTVSFTVSTTDSAENQTREKEEDRLGYDWSFLREWAGATLDSTSQARMLFESEKKDRMDIDEAVSKFIVIKRLLEDELKRRGL